MIELCRIEVKQSASLEVNQIHYKQDVKALPAFMADCSKLHICEL